jgi:magnesium transporter
MPRYVRKRSGKLGKAPGTVEFTGTRRVETAGLTLFRYDEATIDEWSGASFDDVSAGLDGAGAKWLNVDGLHDTELVQTIGDRYGLHPLTLEDLVSPGQRAKLEEHEGYTFIVARMLHYDPSKPHVESEQVSLVVTGDTLLSFQERPGDVFDAVRDRLRSSSGRIRTRGPDYLAYALLDVIVDHYFVTLEAFGDEIEVLEEAVVDNPDSSVQGSMRKLRSNLILVRRAAWPMREVLSAMARTDSPVVTAETAIFVRDAYDHAMHALDVVESLRDVVSGLMDLYMTSLSNRLNDVMKVLTIIGTIFIPLSFIAGVYGMNFDHMPELHLQYGYGLALLLMAATAGSLLIYFRRKKWL